MDALLLELVQTNQDSLYSLLRSSCRLEDQMIGTALGVINQRVDVVEERVDVVEERADVVEERVLQVEITVLQILQRDKDMKKAPPPGLWPKLREWWESEIGLTVSSDARTLVDRLAAWLKENGCVGRMNASVMLLECRASGLGGLKSRRTSSRWHAALAAAASGVCCRMCQERARNARSFRNMPEVCWLVFLQKW